MNLKHFSLLIILLLGAKISLSAQSMEDALRFMAPNAHKSPREAALGTAFFGFSDDAAGLLTNPAGLTLIPAWELALGANLTSRSTSSLFLGNKKSESNNEFYFSNVQMIIPTVVTENNPFNIRMGFSYNTDNDYTVNTNYSGFNPRNTFIANQAAAEMEWVPGVGLADADFAILTHDSLQQDGFVYEDGGLHNFAFGGGIDIGNIMSFGASLMIKSGTYEYSRNYFETDIYEKYQEIPNDLRRLSVQEDLMQEIIGVSGVVGLQARINQYLRLGLAVKFPSMLNITEEFTSFYEVDYDFVSAEGSNHEEWPGGIFMQEYTVVTPWEFSFGLSGNVLGLSYSVAASMQDAAGLYFDVDSRNLNYDDLQFFDDLNEQIESELQTQYKLGVGLEYKVPETPLYVRGSYSMQTSPYNNSELGSDVHIIGGGVGLVVSNNFILDAAVSYSSSDYLRSNYGSMAEPALMSLYTVEQSVTSFLLGFKFRF